MADIFPRIPLERACDLAAELPAEWLAKEPGAALREPRIFLHLTQRQLAAAAGIRQPLLVRIERGADCKISTIRKILQAMEGRLVLAPYFAAGFSNLQRRSCCAADERRSALLRARWLRRLSAGVSP